MIHIVSCKKVRVRKMTSISDTSFQRAVHSLIQMMTKSDKYKLYKKKRDSRNGHSPYELSLLLLDNTLHKALGLEHINSDNVMLNPKLIK